MPQEENVTPPSSEPPQPAEPVPDSQRLSLQEPAQAAVPRDEPIEHSSAPVDQRWETAHSDLPEDLRVPWDWLDLLILLVVAVGATFLVSAILVAVFRSFGVTRAEILKSTAEGSVFTIVNQALLSIVLLGYLAAQIRVRVGMPFWRTIGWRKLKTSTMPQGIAYLGFVLAGFMFSLLIQIASAAFGTKAKLPIERYFQDRRSTALLMVMGVLLAPVVEETIFRGYIYPVLARTWGIGWGILGTGLLFGALHAPQLWGGWIQILLLVCVGIVFTAARAKTKTVVASYLLHLSYNFFLFFAFVVSSSGFRHLPISH
jgi:uncharacterized protein